MLTLNSNLDRTVRLFGARPAILDSKGGFTWREFAERVGRVAGLLRSLGLGRSQRFGILCRNGVRNAELMHGGYWLGAVPVPVNYRLAPPEIAYILGDAECRIVAVEEDFSECFDAPKLRPWANKLLLVGGGYGVAPLYFLAQRAASKGWSVSVVIGARSADDVVFAERFRSLGTDVVITTEDGSLGQRGLSTDAAADLVEQATYHTVYACGPEAMLESVEELAQARGVPAQLSYERYMRCGFGVCGSCARNSWLVCKDGPVRYIAPLGRDNR